MELSRRLSAVAMLVSKGNRVADVGTDHGFIPIWLVLEKRIPSAIAMDINAGPLERAKEHIAEYHLEDYIEIRRSNGVEKLKTGEVDTVVIAGMGGPLMARILSDGQSVLASVKELVLQPQSEIGQFRHSLEELQYEITDETIVFEEGKYYPMMRAVHCSGHQKQKREIEYQYGSFLLREKNPVLKEYLYKEQKTTEAILARLKGEKMLTETSEVRMRELENKISEILEALYEMQ